jgi:ubiquinone/menaquinone biosynthesis C-methylase UbiE
MKTDYPWHDVAYQRKRLDPDYVGWSKSDGLAEDLQLTWQPLMQREAFPKQGNLLELGCGAGNLSVYFSQAGYKTTGIDIAPTAIHWAIENAGKANVEVNFMQGDVLTLLDIVNESFDIALDGRCFHCIIGRDRDRFLRSVHRVLKVGGILIICSMCNQIPDTPYYREHFDPVSRCILYQDVAIRYIGDSNEILKEVISANFRLLDVKLVPPMHQEDFADLQLIAAKI